MKKITLLVFLFVFSLHICGQKGKFSITKTPDWVKKIENLNSDSTINETSSGYYYHLIDFQKNVEDQSYFSHYTIEAINNEGIQQVSDISIDFDPSYQKLYFHHINIIREGKIINKLFSNQIKTVQRESNMERFLYDGTLTAFINLTDVRKGDFIDYSFTLKGSNPVYENKFHSKIYFQYSIPVRYLYNRLITSKDRKLNFKYFNEATKASISSSNGFVEYLWENKKIAPLIYDINTPSWHDPLPNVSISEYNSWKEVIDQYAKHYTITSTDQKKLKKEVIKLFANTPKDSLFSKIRKFVQDDIRYLGFEGGLNSHIPNNPLQVIEQRYGDCKAKSFLLTEILRDFDFEANPILVNSYNGKKITEELPSPNLFDHCIVQVKQNGENYYIDPTISNQGGTIDNIFIPNYETGLVLNTRENQLSEIKSTSKNTIRILEEFDLDEIGGTGYLFVTTLYNGSYANDQRMSFAKKDIKKTQKEYLNFYSALYPSIREFSKIEFIDNRENINQVTIKESYFIDSLWTKSPQNKDILVSEFYPLNMESYANLNKSPERTMPYYVQYPIDFEQKIVINLPEDWNVQNESTVVEENSFKYTYDVNYSYRKITLNHTYKTLKNHISPKETSTFIAKHEKILNNLSYMLTYNKGLVSQSSGASWQLILLSLLTLFICGYFAYKIFVNYNIKTASVFEENQNIGGWLILIAIGLIFTPFLLLLEIFRNFDDFFSTSTWEYILQDHQSFSDLFTSLLIVFEIVYNAAFFVFSMLILSLFFTRRTILPKMIILFYALSFIIPTLDSIIAFSINEFAYTETEKIQAYKEAGKSFIKAAIWIPYFIVSKRVKTTFTQLYTKKNKLF